MSASSSSVPFERAPFGAPTAAPAGKMGRWAIYLFCEKRYLKLLSICCLRNVATAMIEQTLQCPSESSERLFGFQQFFVCGFGVVWTLVLVEFLVPIAVLDIDC